MANADKMMAKIKCNVSNKEFLNFYEDDLSSILEERGFEESIVREYKDSSNSFLGNIGLLFIKPNDGDKFIDTFKNAWRSFVDCVEYHDSQLTIYFRSADGGSEDYFNSLYRNFKDYIEEICITLSDEIFGEELEFLQDEYGSDFKIEIDSCM